MAQFIGKVRGQRGEASRSGGKGSGIMADVNGWTDGVAVVAAHENGRDVFRIYRTGGSNGVRSSVLIATWHGGDPVIVNDGGLLVDRERSR